MLSLLPTGVAIENEANAAIRIAPSFMAYRERYASRTECRTEFEDRIGLIYSVQPS